MAGFYACLGVLAGVVLHRHLELLRRKAEQEQRERLALSRLEVIHEMAGAVCHEFGQPLTAITLWAERLASSPADTAVVREAAEAMTSASARMGQLIHQLQGVTRDATKPYLGQRRIIDLARASRADASSSS